MGKAGLVSGGTEQYNRSTTTQPLRTVTAFRSAVRKELLGFGRELVNLESLFRHRQREGAPVSFILLDHAVQVCASTLKRKKSPKITLNINHFLSTFLVIPGSTDL